VNGVRPRALGVLALVIHGLLASVASAASHRTASLSWVELPGAEACGGAPAVAREVERHLGHPALVSPTQAELSIEGRVERTDERPQWRAFVQLRDSAGTILGTRELTSDAPGCDELRDSASLAMALMIDPDSSLRAPQPAQPRSATPLRETAPSPAPVSDRRWRIVPAASAAIGVGLMPAPSTGVLTDLSVTAPRFWTAHVFGGVWVPQTEVVQDRATVRFLLASGGLAVCPITTEARRRVYVEVCSGAEFGLLQGQSERFDTSRPTTVSTLRVLAGAHADVRLAGPVDVRTGASVGTALLRSHFVYEDAAGVRHDVFDPPVLSGVAELGLSVVLP
jgi:hypothetical protein